MARDMSWIATAKIKAVAPDPQPLISFLEAYVGWEQYVLDQIWDLEDIPGKSKLHRMFYHRLKRVGFRAHRCHRIEQRAAEIVRGVREQYKKKLALEIAREIRGFYGRKKLSYGEEKAIMRLAEEIYLNPRSLYMLMALGFQDQQGYKPRMTGESLRRGRRGNREEPHGG